MDSSAQRILLTGGAGFIGSHLAEALLSSSTQLVILDNLNDFYLPEWKERNLHQVSRQGKFEFKNADITHFSALERIFRESRFDLVVHLAAYAGVRPSIERPLLYEQVNIAGTLNLLELCRRFQIPKFIFGSSSSVYGASSQAPFSEDQFELRPISPYAASKLSGEMLAYTYAHLFGMAAICLRFFTVYGPRQRPDLAIHKFTSLIESGRPVPVFGDGNMGRDYTYVDDIVAGIQAAIAFDPQPSESTRFEIFNLGNSHPVTLNHLLEVLEKVIGKPVIREQHPLQMGDVPLTWADISKSARMLGYRPRTSLEQGLTNFVRWYRDTNGIPVEVSKAA